MADFTIRTTKPTSTDQFIAFYNNSENGGQSHCVTGQPTDNDANVLANCVGYANGRYNEIIAEITGSSTMEYNIFINDPPDFINVARNAGLTIGRTAKEGAIIVWDYDSNNVAHTAVVEEVVSDNTIKTTESHWNGVAFETRTRSINQGSFGNWGEANRNFLGFIYNDVVIPPYIPKRKLKLWMMLRQF